MDEPTWASHMKEDHGHDDADQLDEEWLEEAHESEHSIQTLDHRHS